MKSNRIIAGVAALLMGTATPAFFIDTNTVTCEKVYDVRLSAETVEIDINDIPENREVKVGINIDNNPGVILFGFWLQKDERISLDEGFPYEFDRKFGIGDSEFDNGNIYRIVVDYKYENDEMYTDNGFVFNLNLVLPSDVKPGDFFAINPLLEYSGDSAMEQAFLSRENSMDSYFGKENFADPISGGIRITGSLPEPSPSPSPSPSPKPSPSPSPKDQSGNNNGNGNGNTGNNENSNNGNGNSSENKTTESQTTAAVTTVVSDTTTVTESETLSASTVSEPVTSVTTENEAPATSLEETTVTTVATSAAIVVDKEERSKTYLAAVAAAAVILVAAAVLIAKKNSTKNDKYK